MIGSLTYRQLLILAGINLVLLFLVLAPVIVDATSPSEGSKEEDTWGVAAAIGNIILNIAGFFTWIGGSLLDESLDWFVMQFGSLIISSGFGASINAGWEIVRDIANLAFVFGFIYIGIMMIFNPDDNQTKRFLSRIIIGALLINFSLYFTQVVIDVANVFAVEIYTQIKQDASGASSGIAAAYMDKIGLATIYNSEGAVDALKSVLTEQGNVGFYMGAAALLVVAGFVFAAGAFMLISRFVVLIFVMIGSPILFAATVFPQTERHAKELWNTLFSYAFFAPIFLLCVWFSLKVMEQSQQVFGLGGETHFKALASGDPGNFTMIVMFVMAIFFLILSLKIAKNFSVYGADQAIKVGVSWRKKAQGFAGRNTIGRFAARVAKNVEDSRTSEDSVERFNARLADLTGATAIAKRGAQAKFGGEMSRDDAISSTQQREKRDTQNAEIVEFKEKVRAGLKKGATPDEKFEMEKALQSASMADFKKLDEDQQVKAAQYLSDAEFQSVLKDDEYTEDQKEKVKEARKEAIRNKFVDPKNPDSRDLITKASTDQIELLGAEFFDKVENALFLSSTQMDELSKRMSESEFKKVKDARDRAFLTIAQGAQIAGKDINFILNKKAGEIARLSDDVVKELGARLPTSALAKMVQDDTKNKIVQANIRRKVQNFISANPTNPQARNADQWLNNSPLGVQFGR